MYQAFAIEFTDRPQPPAWVLHAFVVIVDNSGEVFAAAELCNPDTEFVLALATMDGEQVLGSDGHLYVRINWLRPHCADALDVLDMLERTGRAAYECEQRGRVVKH